MKIGELFPFLKPDRAENRSVNCEKKCSIVEKISSICCGMQLWFNIWRCTVMAGSLILIVPKKLNQRKKKGSELNPSNSFDSDPTLKKGLRSSNSPSSPIRFSFKKMLSWSYELPFAGTGKAYSQDSSFLKFLSKSKPAPEELPGNGPVESKLMENDQHNDDDDDEKLKNHQCLLVSSNGNNDKKEGAVESVCASADSSATVIDDYFEAISEEESPEHPIICDSRVQVTDDYYVKRSVSSILRSVLNKHGDIAQNCNLTSVVMRSYYLECLCFVIRELRSSSIDRLSKPKLKEMVAITNDVEAVGIEVRWLQKVIDGIREAVELVKQRRLIEAENRKCISDVESVREDLEARMQDLEHKEKEVALARAQVEETRERLGKLEEECSQLSKSILSIKSKVESIDCKAKVHEIL